MMLHELRPAEGSSKAAKRKGRGHSSGNGKNQPVTVTRARSGSFRR